MTASGHAYLQHSALCGNVLKSCRMHVVDEFFVEVDALRVRTVQARESLWIDSNGNKKASIRWQDSAPPISGLLANQWAERRLVTQWCHGCRAMRRSVCNASASNAGRSLCVQISRERSYPQPILIPLERQLIALQFATDIFTQWNFAADFSSSIVEIVQKTTI